MALAAGTRLGPYEILALLGAGGMGEVYRARDTRLERIVAIKILPVRFSSDPIRKQRFEREAKAISNLNHPHISVLYDVSVPLPASAGNSWSSTATEFCGDRCECLQPGVSQIRTELIARRVEQRPAGAELRPVLKAERRTDSGRLWPRELDIRLNFSVHLFPMKTLSSPRDRNEVLIW